MFCTMFLMVSLGATAEEQAQVIVQQAKAHEVIQDCCYEQMYNRALKENKNLVVVVNHQKGFEAPNTIYHYCDSFDGADVPKTITSSPRNGQFIITQISPCPPGVNCPYIQTFGSNQSSCPSCPNYMPTQSSYMSTQSYGGGCPSCNRGRGR